MTYWLQHFVDTTGGLLVPLPDADDYGCYHPLNLQTRQLTCDGPNLYANHYHPSDQVQALGHLKEHHTIVGLTEHFQASMCLVLTKQNDELPSWCNCLDKVAWAQFDHQVPRGAHGVQTHSIQDLSARDLMLIEALTKEDVVVYRAAQAFFMKEVRSLERQYNTKLMCEEL